MYGFNLVVGDGLWVNDNAPSCIVLEECNIDVEVNDSNGTGIFMDGLGTDPNTLELINCDLDLRIASAKIRPYRSSVFKWTGGTLDYSSAVRTAGLVSGVIPAGGVEIEGVDLSVMSTNPLVDVAEILTADIMFKRCKLAASRLLKKSPFLGF